MAAIASSQESEFTRTLRDFEKNLTDEQRDDFKFSTLDDLQATISTIQSRQGSERNMRNFTRMRAFLEAIEQYGKVIEVFANSSIFVAFIWGPAKFLLQVTSAYSEAFDALLDAYEEIGNNLPLLSQYQDLLEHARVSHNPHFQRALALIYIDILEFHKKALKYFQQRMWKQLFQATWKTFRTKFSGLLENIRRNQHLVESQANLIQFKQLEKANLVHFEQLFQELHTARLKAEAESRSFEDVEKSRRLGILRSWLSAAPASSDYENFIRKLKDYPESGLWLAHDDRMQSWLNPDTCGSPLLWVNGIPGAGKTILASRIIQTVQSLEKSNSVSVVFFYCKHNDPERNTFSAIAKGILAQLLNINHALLPYMFERASSSGQTVLESLDLIEHLLETALKSLEKVYVVIDGLDECGRKEKKKTILWFRAMIDNLAGTDPDNLRCLFFSQDDGEIGKLLAATALVIKITAQDTRADIEKYILIQSQKIQVMFQSLESSDTLQEQIFSIVLERTKGMFLFAKLAMKHLKGQPSREALAEALIPNIFPRNLEQMYDRLADRILKGRDIPMREAAARVLGWLVYAKRPLKWYEIQGAISVNLDSQDVQFESRKLRVDAKGLCGSLVEHHHSDDTVQLVHLTAKTFLLYHQTDLQLASLEFDLTRLCLGYLSLRCFSNCLTDEEMKEFALGGWYSFLTYAALHWADHLEHWVENCGDAQAVKKLEQQIEDFLQKHWSRANPQIITSKNLRQKFKLLRESDIFDGLLTAISVWKKQCTSFNPSSTVPEKLELLEHVIQPRRALELVFDSAAESEGLQRKLSTFYGPKLYKCPRLSCNFFVEGFEKRSQRDSHIKKHDRGFACTYPSCPYGILGMKTKSELEKHMSSHCSWSEAEIESFPVTRDPKSIDIKQAIRYGLEEEIERWLQQFSGVYDRKSYDSRAFLPVIAKGDVAIVDIFLKHAGGIMAADLSELCNLAMKVQQDDIAIRFLSHKLGDPLRPAFRDQRPGNLCSQPAFVAIHYGRAKVLRYMIRDCGIKPNTRTSDQPSSSLLFEAVASRKLEIIETLVATDGQYTDSLERGQNVTAALCMAIEKSDEDITRELVGYRDCNLNLLTEKGTPIHLAVQCRSARIVKILLRTEKCDVNVKDTTGRTPLHQAAHSCQEDIILQLLEDPNCDVDAKSDLGETVLYTAIRQGALSIFKMILESGRCNVNLGEASCLKETPLHTAVRLGSTQMCRMLLETGKCNLNIVDTLGNTPLHTAVRRGSIKMCRMLLETGKCNVNIGDNVVGTHTPLHTAIRYKYTRIFEMILRTGKCDVNIGDDIGDTPLHEACRCGHEYIISLLLKVANCDMNIRNKAERTALHEAINSSQFSAVKMLLGTGKCNIDTRDTLGNTPLDTAVTHNRKSIRRHLREDISRSNSAENDAFDEAAENSVISIINMLLGCGKYNDFSNDDYLLSNHSRKKLVESEGHEDVFEILLEIDSLKTLGRWDPVEELFKAVKLGCTARVKILLAKGEIPAGRIVVSSSTAPHFGTFFWVHSYDEDPDTGIFTNQEDIIQLLTLDLVSIGEKFNMTKHHSLSPPAAMTHDDTNHLSSPFQYSDGGLEQLFSHINTGDQQVCEHKDVAEGVCFDCWMTFPIDYMPPVLPGSSVVVPPLDITPQELSS